MTRDRLGYVAALDGVRALAIILVLGRHAFGFPSGGFLGVDLFFVLSGFLITSLLLEEHAATGRVSLRRFYVRRARRLLPALLVLLAVYVAVASALGEHPLVPALEGLFYCANIAAAIAWHSTPVAHLWSLAAEEQFYLVWPPLLVLALRRRRRLLAPLLILLLVALAVYRAELAVHGVSGIRLDYGPDTRADGILVGCLFAVWHANGAAWLRSASRAVLLWGSGCVAFWVFTLNPGSLILHEVLLPLIAVYFAALVYTATTASALAAVLAARPLTYLGEISYSLYLWHIPILYIVIGTQLKPDALWSPAAVAASVAAAAISTRFVERPFRRRSSAPLREAPLGGQSRIRAASSAGQPLATRSTA
jgi:peptidoglycan/LPS O-acetylase OafA/YrhL